MRLNRSTRLACSLALALVLVATTAVAQDAPAGADGVFPYPHHSEVLDNGLQVLVIPMKSGGLVAYWTLVRTGSRDEFEDGRTGFAHFFEHMMFRGTEKYPADVYNEKITSIGADANAFTTDDLTAYHLNIAAEDLELVMELESDRFMNLSYAEEVFQTEAGAVYGEYRKNRANPFFTLSEGLYETAFDEHTYRHTTMGFVEDIQRMPTLFDHSRDFFSRYYRPDNSILVIVGDVDPAQTVELAKTYYGKWESGYQTPDITPEPEQDGERRTTVKYEGRTLPLVWIAYKFPAFDPTDRTIVASDVLCDLAFGETSDLNKKLVLGEQVVDFINCGTSMSRDPKTTNVIARVKDPAKIDYVIEQIDATFATFQETPPAAEQVDALRKRLRYGFLMGLDTPDNVAGALFRILAVTTDLGSVDQYYQTLSAVTPDDVREAARSYFVPERRTVALLEGDQ
ncbi:MAG: pitrilysin family protein [Acidobacteriota bacterium]